MKNAALTGGGKMCKSGGKCRFCLSGWAGYERKGESMEPMTDFQFKSLLRLVLEILKNSKNLEDAIEKIEKLLSEQ